MKLNGNSPESSLWHVPGVIEPQKEVEKKGLKKVTNLLKSKHNFSNVSLKLFDVVNFLMNLTLKIFEHLQIKTPKSTRIDQQVEVIKNLVINYLEIVVKNTKDRIPKMITWLLITNVLNYMDHNLVAHFYENELVVSMLYSLRIYLSNLMLDYIKFFLNLCNISWNTVMFFSEYEAQKFALTFSSKLLYSFRTM